MYPRVILPAGGILFRGIGFEAPCSWHGERRGWQVRSSYGTTGMTPVLAAGVGIRHGWTWVLRAASFRLEVPEAGRPAIGIAISRETARAAVVDLLGGLARPAYGELRVLGQDLTTAQGRAAVRRYVGIARLSARSQPGRRVRGLVGHAARVANLPGRDCEVLAAAILDRLALTPWADVPVRAAPTVIARRAKLAAAAVHEPELLLIDGLLDGLGPRDTENVAASIRDLGRDTAIVATGRDPAALALACGEVLTLADGIIVRNLASLPAPRSGWDRRLRPGKEAGFGPRDPAAAALGWTR
jgi:ABC-2 type transport system ATP-binding protein